MDIQVDTKSTYTNIKPELNDFGFEEDGVMYWWASWFGKVLKYSTLRTFSPVVDRAISVCNVLGLNASDHIFNHDNELHGKPRHDFQLTKFGCFLVAMQADRRKPMVKRAQSYFLTELEDLNEIMTDQSFIERRMLRQGLKVSMKKLNKSARRAHVSDYSYFINEGFIGMYNSTVKDIKHKKGLKQSESIYDHADLTELASNLFRVAMTTERLDRLYNPSEEKAAREHWKISTQIRAMIKENTNTFPEFLPTKTSLVQLSRQLKNASRQINMTSNQPKIEVDESQGTI